MKFILQASFFLATLSFFCLNACDKADENSLSESGDFESGVFIVNADTSDTDRGTLAFWDAKTGKVRQQIFEKANDGAELGGALKSVATHNHRLYIVVSSADKVVVANHSDCSKVAEIQGLARPQHFLAVSEERAFITQWGSDSLSGSVAVVNLTTLAIEKTIPCGRGSGRMVRSGNKVYVANEGGAGRDSSITVIDVTTETVPHKILVGESPNSLQVDKNGTLWVLCGGHFVNTDFFDPTNIRGSLVKVENDLAIKSLPFYYTASNLVINDTGDRLYYLDEAYGYSVFGFGIEQNSLNYSALLYGYYQTIGFYSVERSIFLGGFDYARAKWQVKVIDTVGNELHNIQTGGKPVAFWQVNP